MAKRDYYGKVKDMTLGQLKGAMKSSRAFKKYRKGRRSSSRLARKMYQAQESGYVDTALAVYPCDTTGSIALIPTIAQGTSVNQRVGKKVMLKSIQVRGNVYSGTSSTATDCAIIIVYDKRPTGVLPAITDILDTANSNSFNKDINAGRFKILRRIDFALTGNISAPSTGNEMKDASDFFKVNLPLVFKASATGAIADIEEGAVYLVTVGSNAAGATAGNAALGFRTRFLDV